MRVAYGHDLPQILETYNDLKEIERIRGILGIHGRKSLQAIPRMSYARC